MVISRELDYALRIMKYISDGNTHAVGKMNDSLRIPRQVSHNILEKLQDAGIISCTRGRTGGCKLMVDLKDITIFDLMNAIGSECEVNLCLVPKSVCAWKGTHEDVFDFHKTLTSLQEEANDKLKNMDLYSIINE